MAQEVLSDTENNYKNGLATLTELLDAEKALADAQNNLNTSLLNFKIAEIQLIKAKGELKSLVNEVSYTCSKATRKRTKKLRLLQR